MQVKIYPNREIRFSVSRGLRPDRKKKGKDDLFPFRMPSEVREPPAPLDILPQLSQASPRKVRKRHPLTPEAQRKILRLAAVMRPEDKRRQVFVTGTLPGGTYEAMREFSRLSSYVVKMVQTYVPRILGVGARDLSSVYVWEQQERGALHAHIVFECPTSQIADRLVILWRLIWVRVLRAAQEKASCDLFARKQGGSWSGREEMFVTDAELVRLSVDRYLSKYVSKGSSEHRSLFPARWYGASTAIRGRLNEFVAKNSFHLPFSLEAWVELEDVKRGILKAFARFSPKGGKDVSQWFQDWSVQVFGFMSEGREAIDCVGEIFKEISGYIKGKESKGMDERSDKIRDDVSNAMLTVVDKIPSWTQLQIREDFRRALKVRMTPESVCTREGFVQFGVSLYYLCGLNDSSSVQAWGWPKSAKRVWKALEDCVGNDLAQLPSLANITKGKDC